MTLSWTIQRAAVETGLTADTLRYYDRVGLLPNVARSRSGHRRFSEDDIGWIRFLQCLRATGMPIEQIARYVQLMQAGEETADQRRQLLEAHRRAIKLEIRQLNQALEKIEGKIAAYEAGARLIPAQVAAPPPDGNVHAARRGGGDQTRDATPRRRRLQLRSAS